jgi:hypothetical protein
MIRAGSDDEVMDGRSLGEGISADLRSSKGEKIVRGIYWLPSLEANYEDRVVGGTGMRERGITSFNLPPTPPVALVEQHSS